MNSSTMHPVMRFATRRLAVGLVCAIASLAVAGAARASGSELIPSIGVTRSVHDSNADAQVYGGLAVRTTMLPGLKAEIGAAYRSEDRNGGSLKVRQWPVTGSLWLTPLPVIYAGGGVGWYHTTFDYAPALAIANQTTEKFGVHLGGGLEVPLGPAALDLNGRYVFLGTEQSQLPPQKFNPDFWTTTLGLAIRF